MNVQEINYNINSAAGNCTIFDSWKYTDRKLIIEFCNIHLTTAPFDKRSVNSYVREWRAHNLLYKWKIKVSSTKDSDLNVNEPRWRRVGYFVLSILYSLIK